MRLLMTTRNIATTVGAIAGAVIAVASLSAIAGPEFTIAAVGAFLGIVAIVVLQFASRWVARVEATMDAVDRNFRVNGDEHLLPDELKGKALRSLVIWCVRYIVRNESRWEDHLSERERG